MTDYEGDIKGKLIFDEIAYEKIVTRTVTKNNKTSGKVTVPAEYIDEKVYVLFPRAKTKKEAGN
jgi:putative transposon-encoded protein